MYVVWRMCMGEHRMQRQVHLTEREREREKEKKKKGWEAGRAWQGKATALGRSTADLPAMVKRGGKGWDCVALHALFRGC